MKEGVKSRRTDISFGLSFKKRRGVKSKTTYILLSRGNRLESFGSLLRMQSIKLRMVYILLRMSVIDIANESSSIQAQQ
jgi:hypothetical protein